MPSSGDWLVGVVLNIIGSVMINLGTNLMKLSHNLNEKVDIANQKPSHRNPKWLAALAVFIVGNILNFSSFGFAAQSMLAAMGSIQFVSNVIFGIYILKETVTRRVVLATSLILFGNVFCVVFAAQGTDSPDASELMNYFIRASFVAYLIFVAAATIVFVFLYNKELHRKLSSKDQRPSRVLPLYYAAASGIGCSLGVLCAKSISILLKLSVEGDNQLDNPFTYALIAALVALIITWMKRLNRGLQLFDALLIIPMLQVFWTTFSIISGGIFFDEFASQKPYETCLFFFGVLIVMAGVFSLSPTQDEGVILLDDSEFTESIPMEDALRKRRISRLRSRQGSTTSISSDYRHHSKSRASVEIPFIVLSGLVPSLEAATEWQSSLDEASEAIELEMETVGREKHMNGATGVTIITDIHEDDQDVQENPFQVHEYRPSQHQADTLASNTKRPQQQSHSDPIRGAAGAVLQSSDITD
eukprot:TRINITY_DN11380_c0_g1_i1.p1 TRINITY_DN11380_c0_g1~~TRINITY_DN11380_c0_g1_i1.p1  ORF type:complete len:473 (+),score=114.53 TRINITY_DN11380_c0_g1_i1:70-1488(+)